MREGWVKTVCCRQSSVRTESGHSEQAKALTELTPALT